MYPKNAASPEPIAIGSVIQISDGAVQTSGCTVRIKPIGVAEGDGAGTTAYSTDGIVLYTPTQAETNYTSFILIAKKTGCIPVSQTIITTSSTTPGTVLLAPTTHTSAVVPTVTTLTNLPAITANWLTASGTAADFTTEIQSGLATQASVDVIDGIVDTILIDTNELQTDLTNGGRLDLLIDAIKAVTDAQGATGSGLTAIPWNAAWDAQVESECADALAALVIEGSLDLVEVMKVLLAFAAGKTDITGSTYTFRDQADTLNRISATVTAGERTAVTLNVT